MSEINSNYAASAPISRRTPSDSCGAGAVAEVQGMFGPVSVSETLIQKIWLRGDFRRDGLKTLSGAEVEVVRAGMWNKLDGPDFLRAELIIDGKRVRGDVEIHFYADDWFAHSHAANPAYGKVVLHVVFFPPSNENIPRNNAAGEPMETLVLFPFLKCDIEEYASEDALAKIEGRDSAENVTEILAGVPADERFKFLRDNAFIRWEQKVRFMRRRLDAVGGWEKVAHRLILETLGLRRNREPMSRLAERFSPSTMLLMDSQKLFSAEAGTWRLSGTRPANLPRARLEQYLSLLQKNPAWATQLRKFLKTLPAANVLGGGAGTKKFRAAARMQRAHKEIFDGIFAKTIGGTRFETVLCDAFFPLFSAATGADLSAWWFHWFLGDAPGNVPKILRENSVATTEQPYCNGIFQGLIQASLFSTPRG